VVCPHYPLVALDAALDRDDFGLATGWVFFLLELAFCTVFFNPAEDLVAIVFFRGGFFLGIWSRSLSQLAILGAKASWNFELT
jgi:hypothetical protein